MFDKEAQGWLLVIFHLLEHPIIVLVIDLMHASTGVHVHNRVDPILGLIRSGAISTVLSFDKSDYLLCTILTKLINRFDAFVGILLFHL